MCSPCRYLFSILNYILFCCRKCPSSKRLLCKHIEFPSDEIHIPAVTTTAKTNGGTH